MQLFARTCDMEQMNVQRIFARAMLLLGGLFWISGVWTAQTEYQGAPFTEALAYAAPLMAIIVVVFAIGLFYEYLAAALLAVGAVGVIVFGIVSGWEAGVWGFATFVVLMPMIISAALYAAAARMQAVCSLAV